MEPRFTYVRDFLEHHLSREFVVTFMPHAILTSANKLDTTGGGNIVVISPATCDFRPLTDWWFSAGIRN